MTVSLWVLPALLHSTFGTSPRELAMAVVPALLLAFPCGLGQLWISRRCMPHGWFGSVIAIGLAALVYAALAFWVVLPRMERKFWIDGLMKSLQSVRAADTEAVRA
jgi:hypothetical protein